MQLVILMLLTEEIDSKYERLTPRNAEGAEVRFEAIEAEEVGAGDGAVGVGDADEAAKGLDEGRDQEEEDKEEEEPRPGGAEVVELGGVVNESGGKDGDVVLLPGLGLVGRVGVGVAAKRNTLQGLEAKSQMEVNPHSEVWTEVSGFRPTNPRGSVNPRRRTKRVITPKALRWPQGDSNPGLGANLSAH
ncbi:hypothetical protein CRG98_034077 [Punica granatum]|uniref:Uncharacterized protein n=1 Tax=Punica granatum TaxID=22663 RepID=A0A2I0INH4_PUNGR|nr:hypothetical protein CRG98_034077 [Punica granatum]